MVKEKKFFSKYGLIIYMLLMIIIRYIIVTPMPVYPIIMAMDDDRLMVQLAKNLLDGIYLGEYKQNTFVKGIGFPLFLAFSRKFNISYVTMSLTFYAIACVIFICSIRNMFSKKRLAFIYTILLFNPAALCLVNLQRVYRNNIVLSQVLIIFASMIALYVYRKDKIGKKLIWALLGGFNLWWMMNTREESFWILPFVITASIVNIVLLFKDLKGDGCKKFRNISAFVVLLPFIILFTGNTIQCKINYNVYGQYLVNEITGGNFPAAMKSIYSVKPVEYELKYGNRISVPYTTFEKIFEVSPTFAKMRESFDENYKMWDGFDTHPNDGQVENGWLFWCIRMTVFDSSQQTPQSCEAIYKGISDDINKAIADGRIEKRNTMPSALMAPWRKGYGGQFIRILPRALYSIVTFEGTGAAMMEADSDEPGGVALYQYMTGNDFIYPGGETSDNRDLLQTSVDNVNRLHNIYVRINPILFVISIICMIILIIKCFVFKNFGDYGNILLVISAILLSTAVLVGGVSYNHLVSCNSINALYLASAYEMILIFEGMAIASVIKKK